MNDLIFVLLFISYTGFVISATRLYFSVQELDRSMTRWERALGVESDTERAS